MNTHVTHPGSAIRGRGTQTMARDRHLDHRHGHGRQPWPRPKLWQVTTNDTSHFLPNKYESVRATQFGQAHFGQLKDATAVTALVRRADGRPLTPTDRARTRSAVAQMTAWRPDWSDIGSRARSSRRRRTANARGAVGRRAAGRKRFRSAGVASVQGQRPGPHDPEGVQAVPPPRGGARSEPPA